MKQAKGKSKKAKVKTKNALRLITFAFCLFTFAFLSSCNVGERRGVPAGAQGLIDRVTEHIAAGRDDQVYAEASEEWQRATTEEQSREALRRVRERLGKVESRAFHSGQEQQNATSASGGELSGHTLTVIYETTFERGKGMENFTLVERDGRWQLARYFVNSEALQK